MKYAPYYPATPTPIEILKIKDTSLFWVAVAVLITHIFFTLLTIYSSPETIKPAARQQVVVKTVQLNPRSITTLSPINPAASQKSETIIEKPVTQQSIPEPIPEIKVEPKKVEAPVEAPPVIPIKLEEPVVIPEPEITPTPIPNKPEPEVIKEQPQAKPPAAIPKKTQTPKPAEKKPKTEPKPKPDPKAAPAKKADPKPAKTNQAPVKKASTETKKPKAEPIKKEPTAEEIAAQETEKLRQKEIAEAQVKQRELLAKAKENLAKIGESREKIGSGSSGNSGSFSKVSSLDDTMIPQQLGNLQIDALPVGTTIAGELSAKEASYRDEIAVRLKLRLSLPDYGAVKLKLILNRSGKVESVQIISSESQKNKQYVEKTVPTLIFPSFGNRFGDASQYSFVVTLNNDH